MENASKALLMAAVVLIGVIILTLAVYLFTYFSSYAKGVENENKNNQIAQFNSQFLSYSGKIKPVYNDDGSFQKNVGGLTIYDVVNLANLAREYNKENELQQTNAGYIKMTFSGTGVSTCISTNPASSENSVGKIDSIFIYDGNNELLPYSCEVIVAPSTQMVNEIKIWQK